MNRSLRILHLYKDYAPVPGGIENHVRTLAEAEASAGHDVTVAVCAPQRRRGEARLPREEVMAGVRVLRLPRIVTLRSMPLSLPYWLAARRLAREADVVHVQSPFPLGEAAVRNLPPGIRLIDSHQSDVVRQRILLKFYAPLYRRFLCRANAILTTSDAYAASSPWLQPHLGKCRTVSLGVDTHRFRPVDRPPNRTGSFRLLFVGRLRYYKGVDTLLEAMATLPPSAVLDIVGTGPMEARWRAQARDLGLSDRVRFLGDVPDATLPGTYGDADLFVLPCNCRAEAFGTVLAEALACGVPCVTCEVGTGTSSVVRDGMTGLVVPPSDPAALGAAIASLMADRDRLARMARAARADATGRLSQETMVRAVLDIVEGN